MRFKEKRTLTEDIRSGYSSTIKSGFGSQVKGKENTRLFKPVTATSTLFGFSVPKR